MIETLKLWLRDLLGETGYGLLGDLFYNVIAPLFGEPRLHPVLIFSALLVVAVYYVVLRSQGRAGGSLLRYVFPREVWLHPSALLDYRFYVVNSLLMAHIRFGQWVVGLVALLQISELVSGALAGSFGARAPATPGPVVLGVFTLITFLAWDFGKWLAHYLAHKVPLLWEFHKPHHAAEVLTPISAYRAHPFDIMLDFLFRLLFTGVTGGVFAWMYPSGIAELQILGFNAAGLLLTYLIGHLQHSHIPLGYGPFWSRILISPVMHQIHHSCEVRHWDKNFGFGFALWDTLFRTVYVPERGESVTLGLPAGKGAGQYTTLREMYLRPFLGCWRLLARRQPQAPTTAA